MAPTFRSGYVVPVVLAVLALLLRAAGVFESLWLDELHTAWAAWAGWTEVAPRAAIGNQTPLYFWLCKAQLLALGPSEWSLRLGSLTAGVALPPLLYAFTRRCGAAVDGAVLSRRAVGDRS